MNNANPNLVKELNMNTVRRVMKQTGEATKPQLSKLTGLSVVTINSLVKKLLDLGELMEDKPVPSKGGRPALNFRFNYDHRLALIIHLFEKDGKDVMYVTVINLDQQIAMQEKYPFQITDKKPFNDMMTKTLSLFPSVKVIGIGIPGQSVNGTIVVSSTEKLYGLRLKEIQTKFGLPVITENDVNAAISGYCCREEVSENECILGVYFPEKSPPGMGIYLNGRIVKGKNGMAGEIKFLPLAVDWSAPMDNESFIETVCKVLQSLSAVLAPDKIVLYQERINKDRFFQSWESYQLDNPLPTCPEIFLSTAFYEDFENGMQWLTLKELAPATII